MPRILLAALAVMVAAGSAGCLQKDTTSTICLRQDGSLDWMVLEQHVRSNEDDATRRGAEEAGFIDAVARDEHTVAAGLRALGGHDVKTRLLRDRRPYAVMVDAEFDSLSTIVERELTTCGVPHQATLTRLGDVTTWTLWADIGLDGENLSGETCGDAFSGLIDALDVTIVLESGSLVKATGFSLKGTDTAALDQAAIDDDALAKNNGRVTLSLSWTAGMR